MIRKKVYLPLLVSSALVIIGVLSFIYLIPQASPKTVAISPYIPQPTKVDTSDWINVGTYNKYFVKVPSNWKVVAGSAWGDDLFGLAEYEYDYGIAHPDYAKNNVGRGGIYIQTVDYSDYASGSSGADSGYSKTGVQMNLNYIVDTVTPTDSSSSPYKDCKSLKQYWSSDNSHTWTITEMRLGSEDVCEQAHRNYAPEVIYNFSTAKVQYFLEVYYPRSTSAAQKDIYIATAKNIIAKSNFY